jgi:uncharacterized protein (DUF2141 family)
MSTSLRPLRRLFLLPVATAALTAFAALTAANPAWALDLTVEVSGARSTQGTVSVAVYSAEGWLKQAVKQDRIAAGERVLLVFRDLAAGSYALAAFHDENGNGKLDANVIGIPTEPYGFSREARGSFGAPKFDAAAIELKADTTIRMVLQ